MALQNEIQTFLLQGCPVSIEEGVSRQGRHFSEIGRNKGMQGLKSFLFEDCGGSQTV